MIFALDGEIYALQATKMLLKTAGIVYELQISLRAYEKFRDEKKIFILTTQIIREDAHTLVGFCDELEKEIFLRLLKISGIGIKAALSILSMYSANDFAQIIQKKDVAALQRVSGIGAKTASKIMLEISGFYVEQNAPTNPATNDAKEALLSLGFKASEISNALKNLESEGLSTPDLIKSALKILK